MAFFNRYGCFGFSPFQERTTTGQCEKSAFDLKQTSSTSRSLVARQVCAHLQKRQTLQLDDIMNSTPPLSNEMYAKIRDALRAMRFANTVATLRGLQESTTWVYADEAA